jgi:hypothetical protein
MSGRGFSPPPPKRTLSAGWIFHFAVGIEGEYGAVFSDLG